MAKDRKFPDSNNASNDAVLGLASPKDRLAAYILDCILLLPIVQLLQSPFKKWIMESFLFNEGANVSTFRVFNLLIFVSLFILYYTFMIAWKGQTLGKMFFSIKVISYHGQLGVVESFWRAVFIFLEMLSLGLPFAAIFTHPMRRPIHDRIADTFVISHKNPVSFPHRSERRRAQWASGFMSLIIGVTILSYVMTDSKTSIAVLDDLEACDKAVAKVDANLERIYELHLLGQVSDLCLQNQARESLWQSKDKALAQFAMAMAVREDLPKAKEYINTLCKENENSHLCHLSLWTLRDPQHQRAEFVKLQKKMTEISPYNFVRIYLAALMNNDRDYVGAQEVLKPIDHPGLLEPVVGALTFHSLLGQLKWDEAFWVAKTHARLGDDNLLYFMQLELKKSQLSTQQQIQLLDYFYPSLSDKSSRQPASTKKIPNEIRDIYNILEGRL